MTAVAQLLDTVGALVNSANAPTFNDSNSGVLPKGYQFPQSSTKPIVLKARAEFFSASTATLKLSWYSLAGSVAGNVTWQAEVAAVTPGDAVSVEGKGYAAAQSATTAVNATAKGEQQTTITLVNLDSLAANDDLWIRISRTDTSMVGDAVLFDATLVYDDGQGTGVTGPGSTTAFNLALFGDSIGATLVDSFVYFADVLRMSAGTGSQTVGNLVSFNTLGTPGGAPVNVGDSGVLATSVVLGPASVTTGRVAVFNGTTGKLLQQGTQLAADLVSGPASSAHATVALFSGTTGKALTTSGFDSTSLVRNGSTTTTNAIAKWGGTGGNFVTDTSVLVDASQNVTGMGTLNTRTIANWVDGPASVTADVVAAFSGTTGKLIKSAGFTLQAAVTNTSLAATVGNVASFTSTNNLQDSGKVAIDLVTGPASVTTGRVVAFNGTTGKLIQQGTQLAADLVSGPASASAGNIAALDATGKILSDSGVSATAHAARHLPNSGTDTEYTGTWAAGDEARWNGTIWVPKVNVVVANAGSVISGGSTGLADIPSLTFAITRAGTYRLSANIQAVMSGTAAIFFFAWNFTGTVTALTSRGLLQSSATAAAAPTRYCYMNQVANNAQVATTWTGTATNETLLLDYSGFVTVSTTGTLTLRLNRTSTATTLTLANGCCITLQEA